MRQLRRKYEESGTSRLDSFGTSMRPWYFFGGILGTEFGKACVERGGDLLSLVRLKMPGLHDFILEP